MKVRKVQHRQSTSPSIRAAIPVPYHSIPFAPPTRSLEDSTAQCASAMSSTADHCMDSHRAVIQINGCTLDCCGLVSICTPSSIAYAQTSSYSRSIVQCTIRVERIAQRNTNVLQRLSHRCMCNVLCCVWRVQCTAEKRGVRYLCLQNCETSGQRHCMRVVSRRCAIAAAASEFNDVKC
jgi:hypothetical protein